MVICSILAAVLVELLLNLAWLLVTAVCSAELLRRIRRSTDSARMWVLVAALVCVMVLLFPVISMTDDLHAEVFTAEENGKQRVAAVQIQHLAAFVHVLATGLLIFIAAPICRDSVSAADISAPRSLSGTRAALFIRPPPALVLP